MISYLLISIYETHLAWTNYDHSLRRGCRDALRGVQAIIAKGYICIIHLERFFTAVSDSKLIAILSCIVKDATAKSVVEQYHAQRIGLGTRTQGTYLCELFR